jgi:hypothetical protein
MNVKRLAPTSYAMALAVLSSAVLPFPVWVAFSGFGYFWPMFAAQFLVTLPFLFNLANMLSATMNGKAAICVTILAVYVQVGIYWLLGKAANAWLMRRYPWFKSIR